MAKKKSSKLVFEIPERKGPPVPELCPFCVEFCEPIQIGSVSGSAVWRCDLCGHKWVAAWFYWQWVDDQG